MLLLFVDQREIDRNRLAPGRNGKARASDPLERFFAEMLRVQRSKVPLAWDLACDRDSQPLSVLCEDKVSAILRDVGSSDEIPVPTTTHVDFIRNPGSISF